MADGRQRLVSQLPGCLPFVAHKVLIHTKMISLSSKNATSRADRSIHSICCLGPTPFLVGHFADEDVAGGVDAAFGVSVEHGFPQSSVDGVDLVDRVDGGRDDRFSDRTR